MKTFKEFAVSKNRELWNQINQRNVVPGIDSDEYPNREEQGLEGPFRLKNGLVVYYDPKEGKYYDPKSDMFVDVDGLL